MARKTEKKSTNKGNLKNLEKGKATRFKTGEEQVEIARQGGIASGEAKRARKALREELEMLLSVDDRQKRISLALLDKAESGDTSAWKLMAEMLGEYAQRTEAAVDTTIRVEIEGFDD